MARYLNELMLPCSVRNGNIEEIKSLAKDGVNLDLKTPDGNMLFLAAQKSRWNILELLIDLGANVNSTNGKLKLQLLHYAAKNSWIPVVKLFVDRKYELDVVTSRGETPLMMASRCNHLEVVQLLVNAGALVNNCDARKLTAIHYASYECNLEIVKFLVTKKADVNCQEYRGCTPLHLALKTRYDNEMIGCLLRAGAACNLEDEAGTTAFSLLAQCKNGYAGTIAAAIKNGAYFNSSDYSILSKRHMIRSVVLGTSRYCTQAIVNKFNNKDLPDLYKVQVAYNVLPVMNMLTIKKDSSAEIEIERSVNRYIEKRLYCDLKKVKPLVLSKMCVESYLAYIRVMKDMKIASNQTNSAWDRLAALDRLAAKQPFKKRRYS